METTRAVAARILAAQLHPVLSHLSLSESEQPLVFHCRVCPQKSRNDAQVDAVFVFEDIRDASAFFGFEWIGEFKVFATLAEVQCFLQRDGCLAVDLATGEFRETDERDWDCVMALEDVSFVIGDVDWGRRECVHEWKNRLSQFGEIRSFIQLSECSNTAVVEFFKARDCLQAKDCFHTLSYSVAVTEETQASSECSVLEFTHFAQDVSPESSVASNDLWLGAINTSPALTAYSNAVAISQTPLPPWPNTPTLSHLSSPASTKHSPNSPSLHYEFQLLKLDTSYIQKSRSFSTSSSSSSSFQIPVSSKVMDINSPIDSLVREPIERSIPSQTEACGGEGIVLASARHLKKSAIPIDSEKQSSSGLQKSEVCELKPLDDKNFLMQDIAIGRDTRTSVMLKNVPNRYTQDMLMDFVNETHQGTFDFFYLRMDFVNQCNVGC
ncbi:hypothetical protein HDU79_005165 [Rhizoclosmatium sp. JEL0117]|nr:hypothetical protein HDU79_005165 [Rhizoclosmatium sp. JEL0117]